jgi:hypothetical protein
MSSDGIPRARTGADQSTIISENITMENLSPPTTKTHNEHRHLLKPDQMQNAATREISSDASNSMSLGPEALQVNKLWVWWKESALLVVALGLLIAIISILAAYGGKPLPKWTLGLNLNTIVALLATSLRSSLVMVVENSK